MDIGWLYFARAAPFNGHWVVVICRAAETGDVAALSITSDKPWKDRTCPLTPRDHPALTVPSLVGYEWAHILTPADQAQLAGAPGTLRKSPGISRSVLRRIRQGVSVSTATPDEVREFVAKHCPKS